MKHVRILKNLLWGLVVAFTVYIWTENDKIALIKEVKSDSALQNWYSLQSQAFSVPLHWGSSLKDSAGHVLSVRELVLHGGIFGLYIDQYQCDVCWKKELLYLKTLCSDSTIVPILLLGDMNTRDLKIWKQNHRPGLPVYAIKTSDFPELSSLISHDTPFYFTIDRNGVMSNVLFGVPAIRPWLGRYVKRIRQIVQQDSVQTCAVDNGSLVVTPPLIEVGEVRLREVVPISFSVKNLSEVPVQITEISASCECLDVDTSSVWIAPGDSYAVHARLRMTEMGDFMRDISFRIGNDEDMQSVNIVGKVVTAINNNY